MAVSNTWVELTINSAMVFTTDSYFCYVVNLKNITDSKFWSNITDATSISVYDVNTGLQKSKYVSNLNVAAKSGLLFFDAPLNTTKKIRVYVAKTLGVINSVSTFTNSNMLKYYPLCDAAGSGTTIDLIGGAVMTNSGATFGATGILDKCLDFTALGQKLSGDPGLIGSGTLTLGMTTYLRAIGHGSVGIIARDSGGQVVLRPTGYFEISRNSGTNVYNTPAGSVSVPERLDLSIAWNSVSPFSVKAYKNGAMLGAGGTNPISFVADESDIGASTTGTYTMNGTVEHVYTTSDIKSADWLKTRYNMMHNNPTFFAGYGKVYTKNKNMSLSLGLKVALH